MLFTDGGEYPLMDIRDIVFEYNADEGPNESRATADAGESVG
jgi:hypothetical protein